MKHNLKQLDSLWNKFWKQTFVVECIPLSTFQLRSLQTVSKTIESTHDGFFEKVLELYFESQNKHYITVANFRYCYNKYFLMCIENNQDRTQKLIEELRKWE